MNKKLVIIGLDGVAPWLIEELIKKDKIPNLKKIIENGTFKPLKSTTPPETIPAWPCMFSGKNPADLGYYGMFLPEKKENNFILFKIRDAFWKKLNDKKIGLLNIPATYPPEAINGFMMSGIFTPSKDNNFIYPKILKGKLRKELKNFEFDVMRNSPDDLIKQVTKITRARFAIARKLCKMYKLDIFTVVDNCTDWIQHYLMKYVDKNNPFYENNQYEEKFYDYFNIVDEEIGKLLSTIENYSDVLIISDHGFQSKLGMVHLNEWLRREGYLKLKEEPFLQRTMKLLHINIELLSTITEKTRIKKLLFRFVKRHKRIASMIPPKDGIAWDTFVNNNRVNWSKTKAYSPHSGFIYLNKKKNIEEIKHELIHRIKNEKIFRNVEVKEKKEIYSGKYIDSAPDLIVYDKEFKFQFGTSLKTEKIVENVSKNSQINGAHSLYGIFIYNKKIKKNNLIIQDIYRFIMDLFGHSNSEKKMINDIISRGLKI